MEHHRRRLYLRSLGSGITPCPAFFAWCAARSALSFAMSVMPDEVTPIVAATAGVITANGQNWYGNVT
jgi:hypothetical protein